MFIKILFNYYVRRFSIAGDRNSWNWLGEGSGERERENLDYVIEKFKLFGKARSRDTISSISQFCFLSYLLIFRQVFPFGMAKQIASSPGLHSTSSVIPVESELHLNFHKKSRDRMPLAYVDHLPAQS